jgi:hypothetical protein
MKNIHFPNAPFDERSFYRRLSLPVLKRLAPGFRHAGKVDNSQLSRLLQSQDHASRPRSWITGDDGFRGEFDFVRQFDAPESRAGYSGPFR